jgi:hypothetical protein
MRPTQSSADTHLLHPLPGLDELPRMRDLRNLRRAARCDAAREIPSSLNTALQPAFFRAASCRVGF